MSTPGSNLLAQALTALGTSAFSYYKWTGKQTSAAGKAVMSYDPGINVFGSVQAVPRAKYKQLGLNFSKKYIGIWSLQRVKVLTRLQPNDQIGFLGRRFNVLEETDWTPMDFWNEFIAVDVGFDPVVYSSNGAMQVYIPSLLEDNGQAGLQNRLEPPYNNGQTISPFPILPENIMRYVAPDGFLDANNGQQGPNPRGDLTQLATIPVFGGRDGQFGLPNQKAAYYFGIQKGFTDPIKDNSFLGVKFSKFSGSAETVDGPGTEINIQANGYFDATVDTSVTDFESIINTIGFDFNDPMLDYLDPGVLDLAQGKFVLVFPFAGLGPTYPTFDFDNDPFYYLLRFRGGADSIIDINGDWTFLGTDQSGAPGLASWSINVEQTTFRIDRTDLDGADRTIELESVTISSYINVEQTDNPLKKYLYRVNFVDPKTSYFEYDVELVEVENDGPLEDSRTTIDIVIPSASGTGNYIMDLYTTFHELSAIPATEILLPIDISQLGRNAIIQAPRIEQGRMYGCGLLQPTEELADWTTTLKEQCLAIVGEDKTLLPALSGALGGLPVDLSPADGAPIINGIRINSQTGNDFQVGIEITNAPDTAGTLYALALVDPTYVAPVDSPLIKLLGGIGGALVEVPASTDGIYILPLTGVTGVVGETKYAYVTWEFETGTDVFFEEFPDRTGIKIVIE
jgi:hypothetical protein